MFAEHDRVNMRRKEDHVFIHTCSSVKDNTHMSLDTRVVTQVHVCYAL